MSEVWAEIVFVEDTLALDFEDRFMIAAMSPFLYFHLRSVLSLFIAVNKYVPPEVVTLASVDVQPMVCFSDTYAIVSPRYQRLSLDEPGNFVAPEI